MGMDFAQLAQTNEKQLGQENQYCSLDATNLPGLSRNCVVRLDRTKYARMLEDEKPYFDKSTRTIIVPGFLADTAGYGRSTVFTKKELEELRDLALNKVVHPDVSGCARVIFDALVEAGAYQPTGNGKWNALDIKPSLLFVRADKERSLEKTQDIMLHEDRHRLFVDSKQRREETMSAFEALSGEEKMAICTVLQAKGYEVSLDPKQRKEYELLVTEWDAYRVMRTENNFKYGDMKNLKFWDAMKSLHQKISIQQDVSSVSMVTDGVSKATFTTPAVKIEVLLKDGKYTVRAKEIPERKGGHPDPMR